MEFDLRDKIDEQYTVTEKYRGGMSVVYIVLDDFSQKRFAVKTVKEELLQDRSAIDRFAQEARTWMNLGGHQHIVEAIIYREIAGQPFLFLEYVDGLSLMDLIDAEDILFPPQVIEYALQVCDGMQYVHSAQVGPGDSGVIHRDLKPANIMINRRGQVKITDFGLAKVYGVATRLTDAGMGLGTYVYMPPEQFLDAASADKTSDIYSFGVALYRSLTGHNPVKGESVGKLIHNILEGEPPRLRQLRADLPEQLEQIVLRCLHKRRGQRFQSFRQLSQVLSEVRALLEERYASVEARLCERCGYRTTHSSYSACPVCAHRMVPIGEVRAPVAAQVEEEVAEDVPEEPAPAEIEASEEMYRRAIGQRQRGRLRQALELLRQAIELRPDYEQARSLLDEVALELARSRAATKQPAYNWAVFRGNITRSGFTPEVVVPPLVRRWQYHAGDWVLAPPSVANGIVYAGVRIERAGKFGRLCALKARNGELSWDLETRYEINTAPCIARQRLYAGSHRQMLCVDARSGERIWAMMADDLIETSPGMYQGVLYFADRSGNIYAISAEERKLLWKRRLELPIYSSPAVWHGVLYVGSCDYQVRALDAIKGEPLWQFTTGGEVLSTPAYADGVVFVASCDNRLYALDAETGAKKWEFQTGGELHSSPAVREELVFVGSRDGCIYAVEVRTGRKKWQFNTGDWVESSPAVSGGALYCGSHDHKLYALEVESGVCLWHYETGGPIASSPAVSQGSVVVGSNDGSIYCFRAQA